MNFDFRAPFLQRPRTDLSVMDANGDPQSVRRVMEVGGLIFEQVLRDGTGEISLRSKEFHCPDCGHVAHFLAAAADEQE
jgi:hypothetical protein